MNPNAKLLSGITGIEYQLAEVLVTRFTPEGFFWNSATKAQIKKAGREMLATYHFMQRNYPELV